MVWAFTKKNIFDIQTLKERNRVIMCIYEKIINKYFGFFQNQHRKR